MANTEKVKDILDVARGVKWCHDQGVFYGNFSLEMVLSLKPLRLKEISRERYFLTAETRWLWHEYKKRHHDPEYDVFNAPELQGISILKNVSTSEDDFWKRGIKRDITSKYIPSEKSDVYGFGRLMFYIVFARSPWACERDGIFSRGNMQPCQLDQTVPATTQVKPSSTGIFSKPAVISIEDEITNTLNFLMIKCCEFKPEDRLTFSEVLTHLEGLAKKIDEKSTAHVASNRSESVVTKCCSVM